MGMESPEMAASLLKQGYCEPCFASDVWALGLLMLSSIRGERPAAHTQLCDSQVYLDEVMDHTCSLQRSTATKHLYGFLRDVLPGNGQPDYADQVRHAFFLQAWQQACRDGAVHASLTITLPDMLHAFICVAIMSILPMLLAA